MRYPIHWIQIRPPKGRGRFFIAICGRTQQPFSATRGGDTLRLLVVRDLYADADKGCEEGTRCFNTDCALNRTTIETLARSMGKARPPKWLRDSGVKPIRLHPDDQADVAKVCREHPTEGVLVMERT